MTPPWLDIALAELGVHETPGPAATARITEYDQVTSLKATSDEVPWCSSFVCWCMERAGLKSTGSAAAASWLKWGQHALDEQPGAVIVLKQRAVGKDKATGSATGYHVGFFISRPNSAHVRILGGNQHDSVKYSDFPLAGYAIVDMRWPNPARG